MNCQCENNQAVDIIGLCDPSKITLSGGDAWTQISIPEVLKIPCQKPPVESIDKVFVKVIIISKRVIETPSGTLNQEGTRLSGRKLIIEGILCERVVYTALEPKQSVHSAEFRTPFSAFIVLPSGVSLESEYCVETCVEDVYVRVFNLKEIFKNITLFMRAVVA